MPIFLNGLPLNVWPIPRKTHLRDLTEPEDVEYEELETTTENEEAESDN